MRQRYLRLSLLMVCLVVSVAMAYAFAIGSVQSYFAWYDDEGFMLMTLRQYTNGTALYDKMYTEYGPFYYVLGTAVFRLAGWSLNHDQIRWLTVMSWLLVAAGWAMCLWTWRRSLSWSLAALLATTVVLRALNREPGHPQLLILLLYAFAFVSASMYTRAPDPLIFAALGVAIGAMALTKINIGIFASAALACVFTACLRSEHRSRVLDTAVRAICIALPTLLMYRHFSEPAAVVQCAVFTFGISAVLNELRRNAVPELTWPAAAWATAGFLSLALLTILIVLLHGTSAAGLFDGVVEQPLRFGRSLPFHEPVLRTLVGALSALGSAGVLFYVRRWSRAGVSPRLQATVACVVIVLAMIYPPLLTAIAPGVMWMFVPGSGGALSKPNYRIPIFLIVTAATFGVLMAYPRAGTQTFVAASLVVLAAFAALMHGIRHLMDAIRVTRLRFAASEQILCGVIVLVALGTGGWVLRNVREDHVRSQGRNAPVGSAVSTTDGYLPNSRLIHLSSERYAVFSAMSSRISALCDTLATIPGMNSFHIWSGVPHPNGFIVSAAMVLFDEPTQDRLLRDFLTSPRPCVIYNPELERWGARFRPPRPYQPFIDMVREKLVLVYSAKGYEIRVLPSQRLAWH